MDSETEMQRSPSNVFHCIDCCPLVEEESYHLFVTIVSRYEVKGERFRVLESGIGVAVRKYRCWVEGLRI